MHLETGVADAPGYEVCGAGQGDAAEIVQQEAARLGADEGRGRAVAPEQEGEDGFQVGGLMEMQTAQLGVDDEHARVRLGAHDMVGGAQGGHGGVAAHETDGGALKAGG